MMILLQILIGLVILGVLVLIHESGHFLMAKAWGIRVLAFSIGFGKPILKKTVNGTEYRLSSIPFGGFVSMAGEHPEDDTPPAPGDFNSKPTWQRALVAIAGPAANFISAMVFLWIVFIIGVEKPLYLDRPVIGAIADSSAAWKAGLLPGDSIIAINGRSIRTWENVQSALSSRSSDLNVVFSREGRTDSVTFAMPSIKGRGVPRQPFAGLYASLPAVIGSTNDGSPAQKAGLLAHDTVVSINGKKLHSWFQLSEMIIHYNQADGPLHFTVQRKDTRIEAAIVPEFKKDLNRYLIGAAALSPSVKKVRYSAWESVGKTVDKSWEYTVMIYDVVTKLASKQVSMQQLAGPVGIVQMSGVVAMSGLSAILDFMALIGINLAVMNLLPLVITDGGLLLFLFIETLRRKPLSVRYQAMVNRIAIAFFITLAVYVTFNDILRIPELLRLSK